MNLRPNQKEKIGEKSNLPSGSGLVQKTGVVNGKLGLLTFKPRQKFWSKFEPKSKGKNSDKMALEIDVGKQSKVCGF